MLPRNHASSSSRRPRRRAAGVTLLDLALVVLVAGILALVGVPAMNSTLTGFRLSAATDEVAAAVEYAQMAALAGHAGRE